VKVSLASRLTRASGNHHRSLSGTKVAILAKNSLRDQSDVPLIHASEDIIEKNNIVFRVDCPRKRLEDDAGVSNASSSALIQEPKGMTYNALLLPPAQSFTVASRHTGSAAKTSREIFFKPTCPNGVVKPLSIKLGSAEDVLAYCTAFNPRNLWTISSIRIRPQHRSMPDIAFSKTCFQKSRLPRRYMTCDHSDTRLEDKIETLQDCRSIQ